MSLANYTSISSLIHPRWADRQREWLKWRYTFESGQNFIDRYLIRFSTREDTAEFTKRRRLTYCPAFAKEAVIEVRNAIYGKTGEIVRSAGSKSYQNAIKGVNGGVDGSGASMDYFIGVKCLDEMLSMGKVGVFVDMPSSIGATLLDSTNKVPYLYIYACEDILNYTPTEPGEPGDYNSLLLRHHTYEFDERTGLPTANCSQYRYFQIIKEIDPNTGRLIRRVAVTYYDDKDQIIDPFGELTNANYTTILDLDRIPFTELDIGNSLLADAANYQIALMNIASGDVWYAVRANFPFYVEPYDFRSQSAYIDSEEQVATDNDWPGSTVTATTTSNEVKVGPTWGKRYPAGSNAPSFIHPSSEPLLASMQKQEQMRAEIRALIHLAVAALAPASAESKQMDQLGLENGLSYISEVLENGENKIAKLWALYEGSKPAEVQYPEQYELGPTGTEIEQLLELIDKTTSLTLKKRLMKTIAERKVKRRVSRSEMQMIYDEIDKETVIIADAASIQADVDRGLVSLETASRARGYPPGEADKAAEDHAARLSRVQAAQTPRGAGDGQVTGIPDLVIDPNQSKDEKVKAAERAADLGLPEPTRGRAGSKQ